METDVIDTDVGGAVLLDEEGDTARSSVYEIGYHLLPSLSEADVSAAVKGLTEILTKEHAVFVGERFPSKISLAYPIAKRVMGKNIRFDSAYFGWVAFEISREAVSRLKPILDAHPAILRYLIVVTDRDAVAAAMSGAVEAPRGDIGKPKREAEGGGEMSEAALDEALQTIATEDAKTTE